LPIALLVMSRTSQAPGTEFMAPFFIFMSGGYLGFLPFTVLRQLKFSQQWKAAEIYRAAPVYGPWAFHRGAHVAVLAFICLPATALVGLYVLIAVGPLSLPMLLPGVISMAPYAYIDALVDRDVLLSKPIEDAQAANRGCAIMVISLFCMGLSAVSWGAWAIGWYAGFLLVESAVALGICIAGDRRLRRTAWRPLD
jgi:branched-subunit amino acid transport protein